MPLPVEPAAEPTEPNSPTAGAASRAHPLTRKPELSKKMAAKAFNPGIFCIDICLCTPSHPICLEGAIPMPACGVADLLAGFGAGIRERVLADYTIYRLGAA